MKKPEEPKENYFDQFFIDPEYFAEVILHNGDKSGHCWACCVEIPKYLMAFPVSKDLETLGFENTSVWLYIDLCPVCTMDYMNSFNKHNCWRKGEKYEGDYWTKETYGNLFKGSKKKDNSNKETKK